MTNETTNETQLSVCQDCSTVFTEDEPVNPIPDIGQRVGPEWLAPESEVPAQ